MSKMISTLVINDTEVADESLEVVQAYVAKLREARDILNDCHLVIGHLPKAVEDVYRAKHDAAYRKLDRLVGEAAMFAEDYARRGLLDDAIDDAKLRMHL